MANLLQQLQNSSAEAPLLKGLRAEPALWHHDGDVTLEIEKGSSVLAKRRSHMSVRGSVNPGICGCTTVRALNLARRPHHSKRRPDV